ncbi:MAG: glycosyltransferase and protein [Acidimicrobiaceae bacterium]|nr:glycosyltransferase and protein [Acidimicrobiaceae bacterium]
MTRASVVIPVFNREGLTRRCLETILLEWPVNALEVVVVDDGSTDATRHLLARLSAEDARLRVVTQSENRGFAAACNAGADASVGEYLVFLNNDTLPHSGWLDHLVGHADAHPEAAAVGARLLFPDGTVQHAGVTIGQDRNPHHLYVGFPAEHPAVNRSGRVPIVTAACMLVRRATYFEAGGFNTAFRNGHEDVDLCLRLGELGYEIHYAAPSVVVHYESATRGRGTPEASANGRRYREEWAAKVVPSDLARFVEDGLIRVEYDDISVRLHIDPVLGTADHGHGVACNRLLRTRTQQVADLLRTAIDLLCDAAPRLSCPARDATEPMASCADPELDEAVIEAVSALHDALARRRGESIERDRPSAYRHLVGRVRGAIVEGTPPGSTVAVVSRGDQDLLDLDERIGLHFPSDPAGTWLGYHPAGSREAIGHLDDAIARGATHLAIPATSIWWLDQYAALTERLRAEHRQVPSAQACVIFELTTIDGGSR